MQSGDDIHTAGWEENMVIFIAHKSYLAYTIIALKILTQPSESRIVNTLTNVRHTIMYHINCIRISLLYSIMRSL